MVFLDFSFLSPYFSTYNASEARWVGSLNTLVPGKGYIYCKN